MAYSELSFQRKTEIENCLLALMQEVPYEDISVKNLTEKLHLARKTFYHYFPGKQACLESLTDRLICECDLTQLQTLPENATNYQNYEARFQFWMENKTFLEAINRNRLGSFFLDRYLQHVKKEDSLAHVHLSTPAMECDEDILFYYISGQIFLLLKWCHDGFPLTAEEMAKKMLRLLHESLLPEDNKENPDFR